MNHKKNSSFFTKFIAFIILYAIFSPVLKTIVTIFYVLVFLVFLYAICKIIQNIHYRLNHAKTDCAFSDEKQTISYHTNDVAKGIPSATTAPSTNSHSDEKIGFEFDGSKESLDENFELAFNFAESYNDIDKQSEFMSCFFEQIDKNESFDIALKERAKSLNEYVSLVQGIKKNLGLTKLQIQALQRILIKSF